MAEAGYAIGQDDPIDTVLHIGVLVAHVNVAVHGAVGRNTGRLQQDGVDRRVGALRQGFDEGAIHVE